MDRTYQLILHQDERTGARVEASLWRVTADGGLKLVAAMPETIHAYGIGDVFEELADQLIVHQDEHGGQLP